MSIADMISALGGWRGRALMYKEDPIYGAPDVEETIDIPGLEEKDGKLVAGKSDPSTFKVPGEVHQVGSMPPRLSRLGGLLNLLPLAAQGAMDGVMAPTTHSGLDFVSGFQAAGKAKQERDMLAESRKRQAQQDAINMELHRSQIEENRAQGRRADAQAQMAMQPKQGKPGVDFEGNIKLKEKLLGRPLTEREKQTELKLFQPQVEMRQSAIPQKLSGVIAQQIARLDKNSETYAEDSANLNRMYQEALAKEKAPSGGAAGRQQTAVTSQGIARLQLNPDTKRFEWVLDSITKDGAKISDSAQPPARVGKSPKVTASDKRYEDQQIVGAAVTSVMQEYQQAQQKYPGLTREQFAQNIYNPNYFKQIPIGLRPAVANAFLKGSGGGSSKSRPYSPSAQRVAPPANSQPLSGMTSSGIGYTVK